MKQVFLLKTILLSIVFTISLGVFSQPQKGFFVVHCDPNETHNFPILETLVDSANTYNIKLTIEFTSFWVDSILPYQSRLDMISLWQSQGHEIGLHHHGVEAMGIWDGFSNLSMQEIHDAGRDTNMYIGNTDSLYNLVQQISSLALETIGNEVMDEMPSQVIYQTGGHLTSDAFSNSEIVSNSFQSYCKLTHAFLYGGPHVLSTIQSDYPSATTYEVVGVVCHVYNFFDLPMAVINYFKFLNDNQISSMTVSDIMQEECGLFENMIAFGKDDVRIFPNPCNDFIHLYHLDNDQYSYVIYNSQGVLINQGIVENYQVETDYLKPGVYLLYLFNSLHKTYVLKFVKE